MKSALVTGVTGQDGSYLAELLLKEGYRVVGLKRRTSINNFERLTKVIHHENFILVEGEVSDSGCVYDLVNKYQPDEIYNLAAQSHVGTSFSQPDYTFQVNTLGPLHFLEAIRRFSSNTKFYQASTSEMFGKNYTVEKTSKGESKFQDEDTPLAPQSPYAVAKVAAHHLVRIYREAYGIFGCCGILFNHESERRGENFVTRKITKWLAEFSVWLTRHDLAHDSPSLVFDTDEIYIGGRTSVAQGFQFPKLRLGNLDACRDWGHAKDYVRGMWMMMQHQTADDYVIATGETHSIREFLDEAFSLIDIYDWEKYIVIDPEFYRPAEVDYLLGCPLKVKKALNWNTKIDFKNLVSSMLQSDIDATQKLE